MYIAGNLVGRGSKSLEKKKHEKSSTSWGCKSAEEMSLYHMREGI